MYCVVLFEIFYEIVCGFNWILHRNIIICFNVFYNKVDSCSWFCLYDSAENVLKRWEQLPLFPPYVTIRVALLFQYNLFVTPEKLEQTHREILSEVAQVYITKSEFGNMKEQIMDINKKVDKIYDTLINERSKDGVN